MLHYTFLWVTLLTSLQYDCCKEEVIYYRMEFLYQLKAEIANKVWPSFGKTSFDDPLIYYTDSSSYIGNPTPKFITQQQPRLVWTGKGVKIYKTKVRLDNVPFHMENFMTMGADSTQYTHDYPFMRCSSLEDARKILPDLEADFWCAMIIHEFFHNYQFHHLEFAHRTLPIFSHGSIGDSLQMLYRKHEWYKQSVDQENQMLLAAISTPSDDSVKVFIKKFAERRRERRLLCRQKLSLPIDTYEKTFETFEGSARYVEAFVISNFSKTKLRHDSRNVDLGFGDISEHAISPPKWLYMTEVSDSYFYATGYNITRILDRLKVNYHDLFKDPEQSLEDLLIKY